MTNGAPQDPKAAADLALAQANAAKAAAEALSLETKAAKEQREEAEAAGPAGARQRAAATAKAVAEAEKDTAAARQAQFAALIPNFGEIETGTLENKATDPLFGSVLAGRALTSAATKVASALGLGTGHRVLVTSDVDLASGDAQYHEVAAGLETLTNDANALLAQTDPNVAGAQSFAAAAAAVAGALPGLLSLFSAKRTISSGRLTISDTACAAAVIGKLEGAAVVHDDFRLAPLGAIGEAFKVLGEKRRALLARKLVLAARHASLAAEQAAIGDRIATLTKALADGKGDAAAVTAALETEREALQDKRAEVEIAELKLEAVSAGLTTVETYLAALTTVPKDALRSPLSSAGLYARLHLAKGDEDAFTHVLLVQGQEAAVHQVIDDKPLWFKDKFTLAATVTVTYMLLAVEANSIVAAGNANAVVHGRGSIGSELSLSVIADGT